MPDTVEKRIRAVLETPPGAIARLGEAVFVQVPVYAPKRPSRPVYINRALFCRLFDAPSSMPWDDMARLIGDFFSPTIEPQHGTGKVVGIAWADRQADPLNVSLAGNEGSGRAYYRGACFNIKGEKTPLATSERRQFSDGLLEMERCIWESLVAGALDGQMRQGLNGVLAILDMDDLCSVVWRDHPVRRGKIIRVDEDAVRGGGALDRVSHVFLTRSSLSAREMAETAAAFGALEADKYVERIEHGTWSPGNISLRGHLIDFDTVCAVKGRGPQYSSTRWYPHNYFGHEYLGQAQVLTALAAQPDINRDGVAAESLVQTMQAVRRTDIARGLARLMGFDDPDRIFAQYTTALEDLAELWRELAGKTYFHPDALSLKNGLSCGVHVFDTSAFFRIYPVWKRHGLFDAAAAVRLMTDSDIIEDAATPSPAPDYSAIERQHIEEVYAQIGQSFVTGQEAVAMLGIAAMSFVRDYDRLHSRIMAETGADPQVVEARAYAVNEDRFYMFPAFTVSFRLAENVFGYTDRTVHEVIDALIRASHRASAGPAQVADMRLYREGFRFRLLDGAGGYREAFRPYDPHSPILRDGVKMTVGDAVYGLSIIHNIDNLCLFSPIIPILSINEGFERDFAFQEPEVSLWVEGQPLQLTSLFDKEV